METEVEALVAKYLEELRENNAAVFIGAGFSKAAGYVDWVGLLAPIAAELGLDANKESAELVRVAQFHINANAGNKHELNQRLIHEFSDLHDPTENHAILARLPIQTYWTTNYDRLIEKALEGGGKRVDAKIPKNNWATTRRGRDAVVYNLTATSSSPTRLFWLGTITSVIICRTGRSLLRWRLKSEDLFIPRLQLYRSKSRLRSWSHSRYLWRQNSLALQHFCITSGMQLQIGPKRCLFRVCQNQTGADGPRPNAVDRFIPFMQQTIHDGYLRHYLYGFWCDLFSFQEA